MSLSLTDAQRAAERRLLFMLKQFPRAAVLFGPNGCGKRTVVQSIAAQLGLPVVEVSILSIGDLPTLVGDAGDRPILLHVSGTAFASGQQMMALDVLLRRRSSGGIGDDSAIIVTCSEVADATVVSGHWALASAPHARLENARSESELRAAIASISAISGRDLDESSFTELVRACERLTFTEITTLLRQIAARTSLTAVREVLQEDLVTKLAGLTYRGKPLTAGSVDGFLSQFESGVLRQVVIKVLHGLFSRGFWTEERFHREIAELVAASEIPANADVGFVKWQSLGDSAEWIAAELKRAARWRNSELDLRPGSPEPSDLPPYVVIADDIVGSGGTVKGLLAGGRFERLVSRFPNTKFVFLFLAGWSEGLRVVRDHELARPSQIRLHVRQHIQPDDSCLTESSAILTTHDERELLRAFCKKFAKTHRVRKSLQFGFGSCGLAFSFHAWIPNNSVPFLWHDFSPRWRPLLPRSQVVVGAPS